MKTVQKVLTAPLLPVRHRSGLPHVHGLVLGMLDLGPHLTQRWPSSACLRTGRCGALDVQEPSFATCTYFKLMRAKCIAGAAFLP